MSRTSFYLNCVILAVCVQRAVSQTQKPCTEGSTEGQPGCPCPVHESQPERRDTSPGAIGIGPNHSWNVLLHRMICSCNLGLQASTPPRDDYLYTPGIGSHKLHTRAKTWNSARKICNEEGGHLAIVNSVAEARVLMDIFNRSAPVKGAIYSNAAFLGMHDLYQEGDWVTVLGDPLARIGFAAWSDKWGGQPDNGGGVQNCGVLMNEGTLDDVSCDAPFAFFCEIPLMQLL